MVSSENVAGADTNTNVKSMNYKMLKLGKKKKNMVVTVNVTSVC